MKSLAQRLSQLGLPGREGYLASLRDLEDGSDGKLYSVAQQELANLKQDWADLEWLVERLSKLPVEDLALIPHERINRLSLMLNQWYSQLLEAEGLGERNASKTTATLGSPKTR